ncbi:unnamed protein product, partial [Rotaria sp. Silwood2]
RTTTPSPASIVLLSSIMTYDSYDIYIDKSSIVTDNRHDIQSLSTVHCPKVPSVNNQQVQIDLRAQYEHEKDTLTGLNQRL